MATMWLSCGLSCDYAHQGQWKVITRVISRSTEGVDGSEWSCSVLNAQKEGVKSNACFPGRECVYI